MSFDCNIWLAVVLYMKINKSPSRLVKMILVGYSTAISYAAATAEW